jgi:CheY-like chemotaxis protein
MRFNKYKILIVDDSNFDRSLAGDVLRAAGYITYFADSGEQSINLYKTINPDLVVMDLLMPGVGGLAAIRTIRRIPVSKYVPILLLSGFYDDALLSEALLSGADDFVKKPLRFSFLTSKVKALLSHVHEQRISPEFEGADAAQGDARELQEYLGTNYYSPYVDMFKIVDPGDLVKCVEIFIQPVVDVHSSQIVLIDTKPHWRHPRLGLLKPNDFLPVLEHLGYADEFFMTVLGEVINKISAHKDALQDTRFLIHITPSNVDELLSRCLENPGIAANIALVFSAISLVPCPSRYLKMLGVLKTEGFLLGTYDVSPMVLKSQIPSKLRVMKINCQTSDMSMINSLSILPGRILVVDNIDNSPAMNIALAQGVSLLQGDHIYKKAPISELEIMLRSFSGRSGAAEIS